MAIKQGRHFIKKIYTLIVFSIVLLVLTACGSSGSDSEVTGTIILPDGVTVPEGATIQVQIQDTSLADAKATVIGEQLIPGEGQGSPIPFTVSYDADAIEDNHTYTMSVRIEDDQGSLLFINDTAIPVITRGSPTEDVEVTVIAT